MCTYQNFELAVQGSAKGAHWFRAGAATVYFDHPVHAMAEHTLNIDVTGTSGRPEERVVLELGADSARRLAHTILASLEAVPDTMLQTSVVTPVGAVRNR